MVTDENKKRLEFLQQELSLLEKQIHRNGNIKCTNNNNNWKYKHYQTEYIHDQYNQIKRRNTKNRRRKHIKQIHKSYDNKQQAIDFQYSQMLQKFMSVYEHEITNTSDQMIFLELRTALHTYLKDTALKAFEAVLNLDIKEFNVLKWLFKQDSFKDVKRAYKNNAQENKYYQWEEKNIPCSPPGTKQAFDVELFGRNLSQKERRQYFGIETKITTSQKPVRTNKEIKGRHGHKKRN